MLTAEQRRMSGRCPHAKIQYCPLYIGMHVAGGPSCWHSNLNDGCAVEQGASYEDLVAQFVRAHPEEFAAATLAERADEARDQRNLNMRLAGVH